MFGRPDVWKGFLRRLFGLTPAELAQYSGHREGGCHRWAAFVSAPGQMRAPRPPPVRRRSARLRQNTGLALATHPRLRADTPLQLAHAAHAAHAHARLRRRLDLTGLDTP